MSYFYDIKNFGVQLSKTRNDLYENSEDDKDYGFCRTQEQLGIEIGKICDNSNSAVERRTIGRWEQGKAFPRLDQFAALCDLLECDADYLMGHSKILVRTTDDISKATGLNYGTVEKIVNNKNDPCGMASIINYLVNAQDFRRICRIVEKQFYSCYIDDDMISHYSENLRNRLQRAFDQTSVQSTGYDDFTEMFAKNLSREIPYKRIRSIQGYPNRFLDYWSNNLSKDRFHDISNQARYDLKITDDEVALYNHFIHRLAKDSFPTLSNARKREFEYSRISTLVMNLIDNYIDEKCHTTKRLVREYVKERKHDDV